MDINEFSIGRYHVDIKRNQISSDVTTHILTPKAIAVLCVLAEHQGEVISSDRIMELVWKGRVVSTNTLQRNISQLRKVFEDSNQSQQIIKTHSKKGYSLEAPVIKKVATRSTTENHKNYYILLSSVLPLCILMILALWMFSGEEASNEVNHQLIRVTPITSSDSWESSASYDPTGKFIVFQRHKDNCNNSIWLREVSSHREWQLTDNSGVYGKPNWSVDGNSLTFTERNTCQLSRKTDKFCWAVNTLSVLDNMTKPRKAKVRVNCQNNPAWLAKWLPDGSISFLIEKNGSTSIEKYNAKENAVTSLFKSSNGYTYAYDYSPTNKTLAAISLSNSNDHILEVFKSSGEILSSALIALPMTFRRDIALDINFHPSGKYLIISAASQLYKLEFDGKITILDIGGRTNLYDIALHPDGNSYIATEVIADTDNILLPDTIIKTQKNISDLTPYKLARSNLSEDKPKFQPNGKLVAFTSTRSGSRQIWLSDGHLSKQLSRNQSGLQSKDILWSPSGEKIAGIFENKVHIWSLDQSIIKVDSKLNVEDIFHWYSPTDMLVNARVNGQLYIHILNLVSHQITRLDKKNVLWANYTDSGKLIYLDNKYQFWHESETLDIIAKLNNQLEQPVVAFYQGKLYGVNKEQELWSYSLVTDKAEILVKLPQNTRYLSDYNGTDFLITQMERLKKDLISIKKSPR